MLIIEFLQGLLGDRGIEFFEVVARLHGEVSLILILSLYFWLINPVQGRQLGLAFVLSMICNVLLKDIFSLPRPYVINAKVITPEAFFINPDQSFPSGYVQGATTIWGSIACFQNKRWVWRVAIALMMLVCVSRLVLGVNFPLDLVAGILLGIIWITLGFWGNQNADKRHFDFSDKVNIWVGFVIQSFFFPEFAAFIGIFVGLYPVNVKNHVVPRSPIGKITLGIFGLVAIAIVYTVLNKIAGKLPESGLLDFIHYWLLTLSITEVVPMLWRGSQPVR